MTFERQLAALAAIAMLTLPVSRAGTEVAASRPDPKAEAANLPGEWVLSYTTKDANVNRVLDDAERKTPDSADARFAATGFLRFEAGGKVTMDRKLRFTGRYEILTQEPRDQLVLKFDDKDIGTYRFLVIRVTDKELVLEPGIGMFDVYRRP